MARFDVYPNAGAHVNTTPYLLDVQTDLLDALDNLLDALGSRVVIALRSLEHFAKVKLPTRLTPLLRVGDKDYLLETPKMGSVPRHILKASVTCLTEQQDQIMGAMDFHFQGYKKGTRYLVS